MTRPKLAPRPLIAAALLLATAAVVALAQAPRPPRRVAILVGINTYQKRGFVNLRWAENDVNETAAELKKLRFDKVVTMTGNSVGDFRPTKANIESQLTRLLADVTKDDLVLVMLCGHGQQLDVPLPGGKSKNDGFYCPYDAVINQPGTMVSLTKLTDETLHQFGGKNIVLVDACRDGVADAARGVRARGVEGRVVSMPEGSAILFSCSFNQQSVERDELKHGVFTYSVLEALRSTDGPAVLTWKALVDHVQNRVSELNPRQDPIDAGSIPRLVLGSKPLAKAATARTTPRPPLPKTAPALDFSVNAKPVTHEGVEYVLTKSKLVGSKAELTLMVTGPGNPRTLHFLQATGLTPDGQSVYLTKLMLKPIQLPAGAEIPVKLTLNRVPANVKSFKTLTLFRNYPATGFGPGREDTRPVVLVDVPLGPPPPPNP